MHRPKIVVWRPMYDPAGHKMLADAGADVVVIDSTDAGEVKQALHGAHALWVRTPEKVTADVLDAGKSLIVVSTSGFGTDNPKRTWRDRWKLIKLSLVVDRPGGAS
jgi:phosphoglycerate dehydrogenase-like enzyme